MHISDEWSHGHKPVFLEPPQSISNEKILERLQTQLDTCKNASFGVYFSFCNQKNWFIIKDMDPWMDLLNGATASGATVGTFSCKY